MSQFQPGMPATNPYEQGYAEPRRTSGLAIASVVCSVILCCPLTTVMGVILAVVALATMSGKPHIKGKGLAITGLVLGLVFTTAWVMIGVKGYEAVAKMKRGPQEAMEAGFSGDLDGLRSEFTGAGAAADDAQVQAFLDELTNRYGAFVGCTIDESSGNSPAPTSGDPILFIPFNFEFESAIVAAEVEFVIVDPAGRFVFKFGSILIMDSEAGDLLYPPPDAAPDAASDAAPDATPDEVPDAPPIDPEADSEPDPEPETDS